MNDIFSKKERSNLMSKIRSANTKPELIVRKFLFNEGYRYRLHDKNLPGSPDIILKKYKCVIQIQGCYWHKHNCKLSNIPKSNKKFWIKKLNSNVERDKKNVKLLRNLGWKNINVWECQIKNKTKLVLTKKKIIKQINNIIL